MSSPEDDSAAELLNTPGERGLCHLTDAGKSISLPGLDAIPVTCIDLLPDESDGELVERAYDFFTFPETEYGLRFETDGKRKPNKTIRLPDKVDGRWREEPLVQRWLFFELLREVVGSVKGFRYAHFVTYNRGLLVITTEHLPYYLSAWRKLEENGDRTGQTLRLARIQRVLDHARFFVSRYCCVDDADGNPVWPVNGLIALSIMVLGETLTRANIIIQKSVGHHVAGWVNHDYRSQGWGFSKAVLEQLNKKGWCMKTIHMLQGLLRRNTIGLLYLFSLNIDPAPGHRYCTPASCSASLSLTVTGRKAMPKYKTRHHCFDDSACHAVGPDMQKVAQIINTGGTPLLKYSKADKKLSVVESHGNQKEYAIFSHVWSDGYGNPNSNQINVCVLDFFQGLFDNIQKQTGRQDIKAKVPELFWIDTLTIPVGKDFTNERTKAISQMHNIYKWARYTIVLDQSLMKLEKGDGYSNPAMKITMSTWMTRLWTLQEAVLSKHLYFNFSDDLYSMDALEELYESHNGVLHSCIPEVAHTYWHGILGTQRQEMHGRDDHEKGASFVASVWKATQWRSTAHKHHETLALATLLNLDASSFAETSNATMPDDDKGDLDKQMRKLLDLLAQSRNYPIPAGMIFLAGPKLSGKGYSWAPRSWLSTLEVDPPDPLEPAIRQVARFSPGSHFEVKYPGFKLHELGYPNGSASLWSSKHFFFPMDSTLLEWYHVEKADGHGRFPNKEEINGRSLAVILPRMPVINAREIAILVAINHSQGEGYRADILTRVWLSRERDQPTLQRWRDDFQKNQLQNACLGEELPSTQRWFLDGNTPIEEQTGSDTRSIISRVTDAANAAFEVSRGSLENIPNPLRRQSSFARRIFGKMTRMAKRPSSSSDGGSLMKMISETPSIAPNGRTITASGRVGSFRLRRRE